MSRRHELAVNARLAVLCCESCSRLEEVFECALLLIDDAAFTGGSREGLRGGGGGGTASDTKMRISACVNAFCSSNRSSIVTQASECVCVVIRPPSRSNTASSNSRSGRTVKVPAPRRISFACCLYAHVSSRPCALPKSSLYWIYAPRQLLAPMPKIVLCLPILVAAASRTFEV